MSLLLRVASCVCAALSIHSAAAVSMMGGNQNRSTSTESNANGSSPLENQNSRMDKVSKLVELFRSKNDYSVRRRELKSALTSAKGELERVLLDDLAASEFSAITALEKGIAVLTAALSVPWYEGHRVGGKEDLVQRKDQRDSATKTQSLSEVDRILGALPELMDKIQQTLADAKVVKTPAVYLSSLVDTCLGVARHGDQKSLLCYRFLRTWAVKFNLNELPKVSGISLSIDSVRDRVADTLSQDDRAKIRTTILDGMIKLLEHTQADEKANGSTSILQKIKINAATDLGFLGVQGLLPADIGLKFAHIAFDASTERCKRNPLVVTDLNTVLIGQASNYLASCVGRPKSDTTCAPASTLMSLSKYESPKARVGVHQSYRQGSVDLFCEVSEMRVAAVIEKSPSKLWDVQKKDRTRFGKAGLEALDNRLRPKLMVNGPNSVNRSYKSFSHFDPPMQARILVKYIRDSKFPPEGKLNMDEIKTALNVLTKDMDELKTIPPPSNPSKNKKPPPLPGFKLAPPTFKLTENFTYKKGDEFVPGFPSIFQSKKKLAGKVADKSAKKLDTQQTVFEVGELVAYWSPSQRQWVETKVLEKKPDDNNAAITLYRLSCKSNSEWIRANEQGLARIWIRANEEGISRIRAKQELQNQGIEVKILPSPSSFSKSKENSVSKNNTSDKYTEELPKQKDKEEKTAQGKVPKKLSDLLNIKATAVNAPVTEDASNVSNPTNVGPQNSNQDPPKPEAKSQETDQKQLDSEEPVVKELKSQDSPVLEETQSEKTLAEKKDAEKDVEDAEEVDPTKIKSEEKVSEKKESEEEVDPTKIKSEENVSKESEAEEEINPEKIKSEEKVSKEGETEEENKQKKEEDKQSREKSDSEIQSNSHVESSELASSAPTGQEASSIVSEEDTMSAAQKLKVDGANSVAEVEALLEEMCKENGANNVKDLCDVLKEKLAKLNQLVDPSNQPESEKDTEEETQAVSERSESARNSESTSEDSTSGRSSAQEQASEQNSQEQASEQNSPTPSNHAPSEHSTSEHSASEHSTSASESAEDIDTVLERWGLPKTPDLKQIQDAFKSGLLGDREQDVTQVAAELIQILESDCVGDNVVAGEGGVSTGVSTSLSASEMKENLVTELENWMEEKCKEGVEKDEGNRDFCEDLQEQFKGKLHDFKVKLSKRKPNTPPRKVPNTGGDGPRKNGGEKEKEEDSETTVILISVVSAALVVCVAGAVFWCYWQKSLEQSQETILKAIEGNSGGSGGVAGNNGVTVSNNATGYPANQILGSSVSNRNADDQGCGTITPGEISTLVTQNGMNSDVPNSDVPADINTFSEKGEGQPQREAASESVDEESQLLTNLSNLSKESSEFLSNMAVKGGSADEILSSMTGTMTSSISSIPDSMISGEVLSREGVPHSRISEEVSEELRTSSYERWVKKNHPERQRVTLEQLGLEQVCMESEHGDMELDGDAAEHTDSIKPSSFERSTGRTSRTESQSAAESCNAEGHNSGNDTGSGINAGGQAETVSRDSSHTDRRKLQEKFEEDLTSFLAIIGSGGSSGTGSVTGANVATGNVATGNTAREDGATEKTAGKDPKIQVSLRKFRAKAAEFLTSAALAREREARKCRRSSDKADRKNSNGNREVQGSNISENAITQSVISENFEYGVPAAPGQGVANNSPIGVDYSYPADSDANYPVVQAVTERSMPTIPTLSSEGSYNSRPLWSSYQFPSTFILNAAAVPEESSRESPKIQRIGSSEKSSEGTPGLMNLVTPELVSPALVSPGNSSSGVREVPLPGSTNMSNVPGSINVPANVPTSTIVESTLTTAYEYPSSLEGFGHRKKPALVPVARPRVAGEVGGQAGAEGDAAVRRPSLTQSKLNERAWLRRQMGGAIASGFE